MMLVVGVGVLDFMQLLADAADGLTRDVWLRGGVLVTTKPDGSPVTETDLAVEVALRDMVRRRFPSDGFLGEEVGSTAGVSGREWIVDGIDGTVAFTQGRREWSTLIALADNGHLVAGLASSPALSRRWSGAIGAGVEVATVGELPRRLQVSDRAALDGARIVSWPPPGSVADRFQLAASRLARMSTPATQRPSWDADVPNGAMLVAEGRLDAFVLFGGEAWDHAACSAIVTTAGGRWSDLDGDERVRQGAGVYSNGHLHDALLAALAKPG